MRLHIVDGQLSTQPHRVCLFDDERAELVRIVNAYDDGTIVDADVRDEEIAQLESDLKNARDYLDERADDLRDAERKSDDLQRELDDATDTIARLRSELESLRTTAA